MQIISWLSVEMLTVLTVVPLLNVQRVVKILFFLVLYMEMLKWHCLRIVWRIALCLRQRAFR